MGEKTGVCMVLVERPEGKRPLGSHLPDGRIILKCSFRKFGGEAWTGLLLPRMGTCECGNEPVGSIKCWEFLD
jgi:hypothetical protein